MKKKLPKMVILSFFCVCLFSLTKMRFILDLEKPPRFTFQELVDMIEKGIEIPGIIYNGLMGMSFVC